MARSAAYKVRPILFPRQRAWTAGGLILAISEVLSNGQLAEVRNWCTINYTESIVTLSPDTMGSAGHSAWFSPESQAAKEARRDG